MTDILILGQAILAVGPFDVTETNVVCLKDGAPDAIFPKAVMEGWQIVPAALPPGFVPSAYLWDGAAVQLRPVDPAPGQPRHITKLAFRNRFTLGEKIAIDMASIDNPAASASVRQQQAAIRVMLKDVDTSNYIDLDRADTRAGVQQLEAFSLIGTGRALEVLDAPIDPAERPV